MHPLVRLLRLIFFHRGITLDRFSALYAEHGRRMREEPFITSRNRDNTRKALDASKSHNNMQMTWRMFFFVLTDILHLQVEEVRIVIRDPNTGHLVDIGSNDPVDRPLERRMDPPAD